MTFFYYGAPEALSGASGTMLHCVS